MVINQNVVVWNKKYQKHKGSNFAMQGISLALRNFAKLAKITKDSENQNFRYE